VRPATARLPLPIGASVAAHLALLAALFFLSHGSSVVLPPVYQVDLVAAPAGPRSIGEVPPTPAPSPPPDAAPTPPRAKSDVSDVPAPKAARLRPPATKATQVPNAKSVPKDAPTSRAGGGPEGGKGTDAATVQLAGAVFPYPTYLNNVVNQIMSRFAPEDKRPLVTEVFFMIHRDGSVSQFAFRTRSGSYNFDLEARGAIEAAGRARAFGVLPEGFKDDVLPVIFTFSPQFIR
jgi:hypothetical protein